MKLKVTLWNFFIISQQKKVVTMVLKGWHLRLGPKKPKQGGLVRFPRLSLHMSR